MATKTSKTTETITIPKIDIHEFTLDIIGDSSLSVHAGSEKAKREILNKQQ